MAQGDIELPVPDMNNIPPDLMERIDRTAQSMMPDEGDVEDFLSEVDEVSKVIDKLAKGEVDADYVDRFDTIKTREKEEKVEAKKVETEKKRPPKMEDLTEERQAEIKAKVAEIAAEKARREQAREKFNSYRETNPGEARQLQATDYDAWDLWEPSDDESDPWMQITPENCKAMEKDLQERDERKKREEKTAYKKREEGNAAFKKGQYADALKSYELGLEANKRSMELHCNAAQACLKLGCHVQALEHCDSVVKLAEWYYERPKHPLLPKAYVRRAAARTALGHHADAAGDLARAAELEPENKEIQQKLARARRDHEEERRERQLLKQQAKAAAAAAAAAGGVQQASSGGAGDAAAAAAAAPALVKAGGVEALVALLQNVSLSDAAVGNAALCIADLAKLDTALPACERTDAIKPLLEAAHKRTGAAQRNAAIAAARMARHPPLLERLRQLHGLEIIQAYVKP
eukprot:CAMPEP_0170162976 /NCGR_PEP_ID=MMETSP0033_2-20121228/77369_1 /TAXON_ID=195969 /ORGANISM="Dolichomastix tenuilepis, Strain CCMP3274" /LENGTH=462 /DNA_ID=CAMNT_0010400609 /DNA_START=22 /DNA_END=1411 /DNA_ORIENTATION=+